jgi:hypothetical protein
MLVPQAKCSHVQVAISVEKSRLGASVARNRQQANEQPERAGERRAHELGEQQAARVAVGSGHQDAVRGERGAAPQALERQGRRRLHVL